LNNLAMDLKLISRTQHVKQMATSLGFDDCRIAEATKLDTEAKFLETWLKKEYHGKMAYMENHFDLRTDPTKLVPGAKSVIVLTKNYFTSEEQDQTAPKIAKYAYGEDYHNVIRSQLNAFLELLNDQIGECHGRGFVDSAPVLEKAWARRSGIGWMGKHTNVLSKQKGSFFFLAVLIVDMKLSADDPVTDHCGDCTACIDACPTDAIVEPYLLDASKCISYFTIELKDQQLPSEFQGKFNDWMFGCDICQDVCPWNRFSEQHSESKFDPKDELLKMDRDDWNQLSQEKFSELFGKSAVKRTKYGGLERNIKFLNF